jgi:hypothetical protein
VDFAILGFAFRMTNNPTADLTIAKVGDHEVAVASDFTIIADGTLTQYQIELSIWNYCELEVNARDLKCRVWMNDRLVHEATLTETTINFDKWAIQCLYKLNGAADQQFLQVDDIYTMDGSGTVNTVRLGKVNVATRYPKSDVSIGFTRSSGTTSFSLVDDTAPDGDTTYVYSSVPGTTDLYGNTDALDVVDDNAVVAIAVATSARMTEPDSLSIGATIKSGTATADGGRMKLKAASYTSEKAVFEIDPATGARWKPAAVQALAWGQKLLDRILT